MTRIVTLREAGWRDLWRLRRWRNDPETRAMMRQTAPISRLAHLVWWLRLRRQRRQVPVAARQFVAEADPGVLIGSGRLDIVGVVADCDVIVAPGCRGHAYGTAIIAALVEEAAALGCQRCTATIRAENLASRRAFARNRFTVVGSVDGYLLMERPC